VQLARLFGAKEVIATASNDAKLALAKDMGADHLVNYTKDGWEDDIRSITDGKGVDVALEMVGGEIFHKTLDCLSAFGRLVIYEAASGEQTTFYPSNLMRRNQSVIGIFLPLIMTQPQLIESSL